MRPMRQSGSSDLRGGLAHVIASVVTALAKSPAAASLVSPAAPCTSFLIETVAFSMLGAASPQLNDEGLKLKERAEHKKAAVQDRGFE